MIEGFNAGIKKNMDVNSIMLKLCTIQLFSHSCIEFIEALNIVNRINKRLYLPTKMVVEP